MQSVDMGNTICSTYPTIKDCFISVTEEEKYGRAFTSEFAMFRHENARDRATMCHLYYKIRNVGYVDKHGFHLHNEFGYLETLLMEVVHENNR